MSKSGIRSKRNIATYMHAVATCLMHYSKGNDPDGAGQLSHAQRDRIGSRADRSGRRWEQPAFLHLRYHRFSSFMDTAFHIAILKEHSALEIAMISDGMSEESTWPYLKISKKDPTFT